MRTLRSKPADLLLGCLIIIEVFFIFGCAATSGKNFSKTQNDSLILGKTTSAEIKDRLSAPNKLSTSFKNEFEIVTYTYSYITTASGDAVAENVIPQRIQVFHFLDKKLVGYDFSSSFKVDNTDFNNAVV